MPKLEIVECADDQEVRQDQDRQFEEKLRLARHLVRALREAGYPCELGEDAPARALKPLN
jgi:hypothetical protein